jgi:membrane protein
MSRLRKLQETAGALLFDRGPEHGDSARHASGIFRTLHFWARVVHSFLRNRCPVHASALAFSSLLGLIPILAVAFSVSTLILKSQDQGEAQVRLLVGKIIETVSPYTGGASPSAHDLARAKQEEAVQKIQEFIQNTQSKTIGGVGMLAFVLVAISMLRRIEATFNDIWGVTRGRAWYTQVVLYWAVISLGPILVMLAMGLTGSAQFAATREWLMRWPWLGGVVFRSVPLLVLMGLFTMLYQMMPNTRVRLGAALAGSLVAGLLWQGNSLLGVLVATRITQNNAIYGSLGMVPVLMIGLYFSWLILLFGAQVAYGFQNRKAYLQDRQAELVNQRGRELAALRVMVLVARQFAGGAPAPGITQLANSLAVPSKLVSQVLQPLLRAQLILETNDRIPAYVPGRALDRISAHQILQAIRAGQGQDLSPSEDPAQAGVLAAFERINAAERAVAANLTLQDLIKDV